MEFIDIKSFAKINLGLLVTEKREDGYHNIETIFFPVKLCDELLLSKSSKYSLQIDNETLQNEADQNLISKAHELLEDYTKQELNVSIKLKKNIPIGAGLGGGSSNGAAALKGINELFDLNLSFNELLQLSLKLGSDVPFFIKAKPVYAEGRGELFTEINLKLDQPILIIHPGIHISTSWAYRNIKAENKNIDLIKEVTSNAYDVTLYKKNVLNDFESPVFDYFPEIANIKSELYLSGAKFALLSGSGSALFAIFDNIKTAKNTAEKFQEKYFTFLQY